jgi:hypothetical protein
VPLGEAAALIENRVAVLDLKRVRVWEFDMRDEIVGIASRRLAIALDGFVKRARILQRLPRWLYVADAPAPFASNTSAAR